MELRKSRLVGGEVLLGPSAPVRRHLIKHKVFHEDLAQGDDRLYKVGRCAPAANASFSKATVANNAPLLREICRNWRREVFMRAYSSTVHDASPFRPARPRVGWPRPEAYSANCLELLGLIFHPSESKSARVSRKSSRYLPRISAIQRWAVWRLV
jgi:hypothetical protein